MKNLVQQGHAHGQVNTPIWSWLVLGTALLSLSWWVVYTRYVDLHAVDLVFNQPFRAVSLQTYHDTLAGKQTFPAQWRVLRFLVVRGAAGASGDAPHQLYAFIKTGALTNSASLPFLFSTTLVIPLAAIPPTAPPLGVPPAA